MALRADALSLEHYPYSSRRLPVLAKRGVVATSEPLAAQAGLRILQKGGNAVDAAIATAAALTVVEPTSNGVGGDALALIWDGARLHGLDGSGRAPAAYDRELFKGLGLGRIPPQGWLAVTVPGAPAAWRDMHRRFGKLSFEALFEPAIEYASEGFPVAPVTAQRWRAAAAAYAAARIESPALRPWRDTFTIDGRAPNAGELWGAPDLARTLRELAATQCESFYNGALAERVTDFAAATGGYLTLRDLAAHTSSWVEPIRATYRGYDVWGMPPSSQCIVALTALSILEGIDVARLPRESGESYHLQIEAIKLALSDAYDYLADPTVAGDAWRERLTAEFAAERRLRIGDLALTIPPRTPQAGGTVYACVADADGMMVSFIQSNYSGPLLGFGSGVVVPETGIALHSRGCGFSLDPAHPNVIAPGKRPFQTLAPAFLTRDGRGIGPFGVMGGPMQPQGLLQQIVNQIDYGMNPQASLDAPRWQWNQGKVVEVEMSVPSNVLQELARRGHEVRPCMDFAITAPHVGSGAALGLVGSGDFGKGQVIRRLDNGVYVAGSDWRADGCAVGY